MRVAIITTIQHNVGDDFVREGIIFLLKKILGDYAPLLIHKHVPLTARPEWEWVYSGGWTKRLDRFPKQLGLRTSALIDSLPLQPQTDKVLSSDLLIQSGAPVYWFHAPNGTCANAEWFTPLVEKRWRLVSDRVPLLNLAGGTCQRYHSDASEIQESPPTLEHIRKFFDWCRLTTVRDHLSLKVLRLVDRHAPVLPCTSIFARRVFGLEPGDPQFVALNYMPSGGHYDFGQRIDAGKWEQTFVQFAKRLKQRERCILACHNKKELVAARKLLPDMEVFYSEDHRKILEFYSGAKYGIVNRVHAAFAIASYGRPALVIGTDSRARMAENIGLKSLFVSDATVNGLEEEQERLLGEAADYEHFFLNLAAQTESQYHSLLACALGKGAKP
jgi:hypothetical protein